MSVELDLAREAGRRLRRASFDHSVSNEEVGELARRIGRFDPTNPYVAVATSFSDKTSILAFGKNKLPKIAGSYPEKYDNDDAIGAGLALAENQILTGGSSTRIAQELTRMEQPLKIQGSSRKAFLAARRNVLELLLNDPFPKKRSCCSSLLRVAVTAGLVIGGVYLFKHYAPIYVWPRIENLCLPCMLANHPIAGWISNIGKFLKLA